MNLASLLEEQARGAGERAAIIEPGSTITFRQLDDAAASAATELAAAGVAPGMRVLVFVPMSIALYTIVVALFRLGATAVFLDPSMPRGRLDGCVRRVRPGAFVAVRRAHWLRLTCASIRSIPVRAALGGWVPGARAVLDRSARGRHPVVPLEPATPAIITFTSGSTGEPKAAARTHGFLVAQHRALVESLGLAPGDVDLSTLPIFVLANLASGVTSVIPDADLRAPGAIDAGPVIEQIRALGPTRTVASPALLSRLVEHAARRGSRLDSFRGIYTGGAPVFPALLDAIADVAPHASVVAVYGSTEAEPIAGIERRAISGDDRRAMAGGAGLLAGPPVASIALRILPDRWGTPLGPLPAGALERQTLGTGAAGEIVVSGDHVLSGYLDGRGDEETKIHEGDRVWHRTGDAGYVDGSGRLWLLGRCSAKVSDRRGVVYPFAVECAASDLPGLVRSAFVLHRGRRVLVVEASSDSREMVGELSRRLDWAHLDAIELGCRIPVDRRHNAKVDYPALRRMLDRT